MKKLSIFILFAMAMTNLFGSSRYWVGGAAGNWADVSSWSLTSNGTSGAAVPGASDDVYFDNSGSNANPTVTSFANITVASITFTNSNVSFSTPTTQATLSSGVNTTSAIVNLSAANADIKVGQTVTLSGTNAGTLASNSTVVSISGADITLSANPTVSSTATGTLTFGSFSITATNMTLDGSQVSFTDVVTINNSLTFQGTAPRVIANAYTNGRYFTLGNGNAFTLTGNSAINYFTGNANANYSFKTTNSGSALTVFFDPTTLSLAGLSVSKGDVTLGNNLNSIRTSLNTVSATNPPQLILGAGVTFGLISGYTNNFVSTANAGVIDASASGSKVSITATTPTILATAGRIFKENSTVNELEFNSTSNIFVPAFPITVNKLTLTAGTINNSTNNITIINGGTITRKAGDLTAVPTFGTVTNVVYSNTTAISSSYELPASVSALTIAGTSSVTLTAPLTITSALTLTSGSLVNTTNNITFDGGATPVEVTRTAGSIGSQYPVCTSQINLTYNNTTATTSSYEFNGTSNKINNLTVNNVGGVVINGNRDVSGTLNLVAGTLAIGDATNSRIFTFKGTGITRTTGLLNANVLGSVSGGSSLVFSNTSPITLPAGMFSGNIYKLTMNGAGGVTLGSPVTVDNTLTLTSGKLTLGANDLTLASTATLTGGSASTYLVTDGAGKLTKSVTASVDNVFPIGTASSYDPATVNCAASVDVSAKVGSSLSGNPNSGIAYNAKEWEIVAASGTPVTTVKLSPATATYITSPVIGSYNGATYDDVAATLSGASNPYTYSASVTLGASSKFTTGATDPATVLIGTTTGEALYSAKGQIVIENAIGKTVSIYTLTGTKVLSSTLRAQKAVFSVAKGIYIVGLGVEKVKVVVD